MEVEEINSCKRSRNSGSNQAAPAKIVHKGGHEDDTEGKAGVARIRSWQHSNSRIFRVSRASGGKDRHSKVLTAKGLRDRRVRLSVSTAIQFYDLQDRLGFDQPSKAVEWLIKAASAAIAELPSLDGNFSEPPGLHVGVEKQPEVPEAEKEQQNQHLSLTKSGCSSTSETSKGSVLSLSRSEIRVKARERARERVCKDKEKDAEDDMVTAHHHHHHHHGINAGLNSQSSFTELLTSGGGSNGPALGAGQASSSAAHCSQKQMRHLPPVTATADYFGQAGLFGQTQKTHQPPSGFSFQAFGSSSPMATMPFNIAAAAAAAAAGDHQELQQFSFLPDHMISVAAVPSSGDYNLNFSISPGLAGFNSNRGTLQSNSPTQLSHHHHHHLQRFSPSIEGANLPFLFSTAAPATPASQENQFSAGFDGRLQLCYGDAYRPSDHKGKGKS